MRAHATENHPCPYYTTHHKVKEDEKKNIEVKDRIKILESIRFQKEIIDYKLRYTSLNIF